MKSLVISCLLLFTFKSDGQIFDSLLYQLKQIPNDTERVNQIYKAGFDIRNTQPELSYQYALECETEAKKAKSPKHLAKSYNLSGILYYKKGDYTKALNYQKMALALNESINYEYGIAINQTNLGNIYNEVGYNALAESSYLKALKAYNTIGNNLQIAKCLINIGVLKFSLKHYDAAVKQFREALSIADQLNDPELKATCNNNIGAIFMVQNKLDSSLVYLEEGLKLLDITDNEMEMADCYNNMANVYIKQKKFTDAQHYLALADTICNRYDYSEAKIELYQSYSFFFEAMENYKQANEWLKKHYRLKDSLLQLDKEMPVISMDSETLVLQENEQKPVFKNEWILVFLCVLLIGIPLFLMRYKR